MYAHELLSSYNMFYYIKYIYKYVGLEISSRMERVTDINERKMWYTLCVHMMLTDIRKTIM